jgi:hypothetical protein
MYEDDSEDEANIDIAASNTQLLRCQNSLVRAIPGNGFSGT